MHWRSWFDRVDKTAAFAATLSLLLSLAGISWGLPFRFHPDEKAVSVARLIERGTVIPESFINPSLPLLAMAPMVALQDLGARIGLLSGAAADPLFVCRLMSAFITALAVWLFGLTLARFAPETKGAAFFLAVTPALVNFAHFATPESWLLLGTVATLAVAVRYASGEGGTSALGFVLGLAVSCKYTAAALSVPVVLAVLFRKRTLGDAEGPSRAWLFLLPVVALIGVMLRTGKGLILAAQLRGPGDARLLHQDSALSFVRSVSDFAISLPLVAIVLLGITHRTRLVERLVRTGFFSAFGFVLGTPGSLLSPLRFLTDLAFNAQTRVEYKGFKSPDSSWGAYAQLLADCVGWPLWLAAALGVFMVLRRAGRSQGSSWILLSSGVSAFALVAASGHQAMRFLVPALPCVAWLGGRGISWIAAGEWRARVTRMIGLAALGQSLLLVRLFFVDSRLEASRWMVTRLAPQESWGLISNFPGYGPSLSGAASIPALRTLSRELAPENATRSAAEEVARTGPDWLVLPEPYFARFVRDPGALPEKAKFFSTLLAGQGGYLLAARFQQVAPWRPPNEFLDPEVLVFRRGPQGSVQ
jgi:hypothetical protein